MLHNKYLIEKLVLAIVAITHLIFSSDYDFDVSEFEKKLYEFNGTMEFRPSLVIPEKESLSWRLKYFNENSTNDFLDSYLLLFLPRAKIERNGFSAIAAVDGRINYNHPTNEYDYNFSLLEGYSNYDINPRWSLQLGKKLYKWGKGYIYSPVSYAGRQKDVNDIDASLEGYYSVSVEYVKSFSSEFIKNLSQELIYVPVYKSLNDDYNTSDRQWFLSRTYFLMVNTDYEFYLNFSDKADYKIGAAAAHNILTNWEIHTDLSFLPETKKLLITDNNVPYLQTSKNTFQSIVGTRYLSSFDATFFLEYIYNGEGLNEKEMKTWRTSAENALTTRDIQANRNLSLMYPPLSRPWGICPSSSV